MTAIITDHLATGHNLPTKWLGARVVGWMWSICEGFDWWACAITRDGEYRYASSDGTLTNQINGLQALVSDAGTGTVGGINSTTWPFWKSIVQSAAAPLQGGGAVTVSATTIEHQMFLPLWLTTQVGNDKADLIVTDMTYFSYYEQSQASLKRYTSGEDSAQGGVVSLKYKTADVVYDGDSGIPASHAYFLNTDFLNLYVHPDADMTEIPEMRSLNQDATVVWMLWMGNLVCSNRSKQGVAKA